MSAQILDGKVLALKLKDQLCKDINILKEEHGSVPRIVTIVVGDDPSGLSYALSQQKMAESVGIHFEYQQQPSHVSQQALQRLIIDLNNFNDVHGIMINKPLPAHLNFELLSKTIDPNKNIEAMQLCTPAAVIALLKTSGVDLVGKEVVVLGRSDIVGKPVAMLLIEEHATVTVCHSATMKAGTLKNHLKRADIVIAAIGQPGFIKGEWLKTGVIILDVGINGVDGKVIGDVDFDSCLSVASFISPVPGGVGPVTSIILMQNALQAYRSYLCRK